MRTDDADEDATVLIVDDEEKLADMYTLWLRNDYEIRTVYAGGDIQSALDESVDVVLLDRRMPGHSGEQVLGAIRRADRDVSVILVTAVTPDFDVLDLPFDDYLGKPVQHDDLITAIELQLTARRSGEDLRTYLRLRAKEAILAQEKNRWELEENERFSELQEKLETLDDKLRGEGEDFEEIIGEFEGINRGPGLARKD
ncbi:MAG: DNA-binding response OmpR family regulator [Halobacteriales archaeon]|jgi:DNA-binding response OmpR family regulator